MDSSMRHDGGPDEGVCVISEEARTFISPNMVQAAGFRVTRRQSTEADALFVSRRGWSIAFSVVDVDSVQQSGDEWEGACEGFRRLRRQHMRCFVLLWSSSGKTKQYPPGIAAQLLRSRDACDMPSIIFPAVRGDAAAIPSPSSPGTIAPVLDVMMTIVSNFRHVNAQEVAAAQIDALMNAEAERHQHSTSTSLAPGHGSARPGSAPTGRIRRNQSQHHDPAVSALLSVAMPTVVMPEHSCAIVQAAGSYRDVLHMTERQIASAIDSAEGVVTGNDGDAAPAGDEGLQNGAGSSGLRVAHAVASFLHGS